jgi:hypothetical protein
MSSVGSFHALCLCGLLMASCAAQTGTLAATKNADIRPAIFQRGPQAVQIVASPSVSKAQLSETDFHLASTEEVDGMEQTLEQ